MPATREPLVWQPPATHRQARLTMTIGVRRIVPRTEVYRIVGVLRLEAEPSVRRAKPGQRVRGISATDRTISGASHVSCPLNRAARFIASNGARTFTSLSKYAKTSRDLHRRAGNDDTHTASPDSR